MDKLVPYSKTRGYAPLDWNATLRRNPQYISPVEMNQLVSASQNWVTCAVGNQCDIIPRTWIGEPEDNILNDLGRDFTAHMVHARLYHGVRNFCDARRAFVLAARILSAIEVRSTQLIQELGRTTL